MAETAAVRWTISDIEAMPEDEWKRYEIIDGELFVSRAPGEPHQITNGTTEDMIVYVVADNPIGDTYYQPDSNKWGVPIPERTCVRSQPVDYFDGEE